MFLYQTPRYTVAHIEFAQRRYTEMSRYEERLESFARQGRTAGFRITLWKGQAKKLGKEGIVLRDELPTETKGKFSYSVDFSLPVPGTFSERLNQIAWEAWKELSDESDSTEPEPLHHPYELP